MRRRHPYAGGPGIPGGWPWVASGSAPDPSRQSAIGALSASEPPGRTAREQHGHQRSCRDRESLDVTHRSPPFGSSTHRTILRARGRDDSGVMWVRSVARNPGHRSNSAPIISPIARSSFSRRNEHRARLRPTSFDRRRVARPSGRPRDHEVPISSSNAIPGKLRV